MKKKFINFSRSIFEFQENINLKLIEESEIKKNSNYIKE